MDLKATVAMVPFSAHLGFERQRCDAEAVVVEVTLRPEHCTAGGTAHGGLLMTLADFAGAAGAYQILPEGAKGTTTIESKTNMIAAAVGCVLRRSRFTAAGGYLCGRRGWKPNPASGVISATSIFCGSPSRTLALG